MTKRTRKTTKAVRVKPETKVVLPTHTFTVKQWKESPGIQRELQAVLDSPYFKMACQTLLVTAMPNVLATAPAPGVSAEAMALFDSQQLHNRSGFVGFYRALKVLALPKTAVKIGKDFGDLLAEDE